MKIRWLLCTFLLIIISLVLMSCQTENEVEGLFDNSALAGQATLTSEERECQNKLRSELKNDADLLTQYQRMSKSEQTEFINDQMANCMRDSDKTEDTSKESTSSKTEDSPRNSEETQESQEPVDNDQDGFTSDVDCDDHDPTSVPLVCYPGWDNDAFGDINADPVFTCASSCISLESEGGPEYYNNNADCNDADENIHPTALDICEDGIDQDCNGVDAACTLGNTCTLNSVCNEGEFCDGQTNFTVSPTYTCMELPQISCSDTDGTNLATPGVVVHSQIYMVQDSVGHYLSTMTKRDSSVFNLNNHVREYYCEGDTLKSLTINCTDVGGRTLTHDSTVNAWYCG